MKIENYGAGARCELVMRGLMDMDSRRELPPSVSRIILLPIPSSRDKVHVTGTDRLLGEVLSDAGNGDLLIGYGIPMEDASDVASRGGVIYDAMLDENFQQENARVSALGALGYILTEMKRTPEDMYIGIVGYGRIGAELVRLLLFFGARVRVYTSRDQTRRELGAFGVESTFMERSARAIPNIDGLDLIVNTAPTDLSATFETGGLPDGVRLIELASGKNFEGVAGVEYLPSIPDRMYPISSGQIYFRAVREHILGMA